MLNNTQHKDIIEDIEEHIIARYDNDTLKLIVNYILKRIEDIDKDLKINEEVE